MTQVSTTLAPVKAVSRTLRWGVVAFVIGAAVQLYSVYGWGQQPSGATRQSSQQHAIPYLVVGLAVVVALVFGLAVRAGIRGEGKAGLALGLAIPALLTTFAYWSGLPVVLGIAAAVIAGAARTAARRAGRGSGLATAATVIAVLSCVLSLAALVSDSIG